MYLAAKIKNIIRAILLKWGGTRIRERIWNREFSGGRWNCLEATPDDPVYQLVEKYCNRGNILDLGCGSGSTGNELKITQYNSYTGIDVSGTAIQMAIERSKANGRSNKNEYYQSDIFNYRTSQKYNVILFRDTIYYLPLSKIKNLLNRYSSHLEDNGLFIVRMYDRENGAQYVNLIESNYKLVEKYLPAATKTIVLVFR